MITLNLEWREVLWWLRGGMAGSHLCWDVYENMVNRVWPQCSEQERANIYRLMRRDFGTYWRPEAWDGYRDAEQPITADDGPWREEIHNQSEWSLFRHVLSCFNPENQYRVTMRVEDDVAYRSLDLIQRARLIQKPSVPTLAKHWTSDTLTADVRAYKWENEYRVSWDKRCAEDAIVSAEKFVIPHYKT